MPTFHNYAKVLYHRVHLPSTSTNTQQPTRAAATPLPSAFPSSLSVGAAAVPSNHGAATPPHHAQATSRRENLVLSVWSLGRAKREESKNRATSGGKPGSLKVGAIFANTCNNQIKFGILHRGRVGKDTRLWWNMWGGAVSLVWSSN